MDEIISGGNALLSIKPHWKRVRLGDIGEVLNGFAFKAELFTREGGMPLIRIRDVGSAASETFYSGDYDERYVVTAGDLLVGMDGDFNCARWHGPRSLLNQRVCKITVDESLYLPRFLDYVLPGYLKAINDATSSVTVKHLSSRTIQDIPLPLPPMDEQREIVAEIEKQFSRLDEAVANLQRVKANLKRYKASVLKAAVEGRLVETEASIAQREGRSYETGEKLLQRILEERRAKWALKKKYVEPESAECPMLESLPEGWANATVEQLSQLVEYGSSSKTSDDATGIPVLRMGNIFEGELRFDDLKYLPKEHDEFPKLLMNDGDLLFNRTNSPELVGKVAVFQAKSTSYSFASYLIRVRTVTGVLPNFLAAYINSNFGRQWVKSVVTQQVGQANVNGTKLQALAVPLPPLAEQTRIVAELDRHMTIIREVESEVDVNLQRAQALRQATLSKAFGTGQ
ncbi:restriction endonuclease subunit S [Limnohabitans sp.]|uniref:restriction endonuclease subunit S n=1 Tax=Limnohabitans sp. TaxID=1907725 RepID=UPI0037BF6632